MYKENLFLTCVQKKQQFSTLGKARMVSDMDKVLIFE